MPARSVADTIEPIEAAIRRRLADGAYDTIVEPSALCEALTGLELVVRGGVGLCRRSAEVCAGDPVRVPGRPLHELDLVAVRVAQVGNRRPVLAAR